MIAILGEKRNHWMQVFIDRAFRTFPDSEWSRRNLWRRKLGAPIIATMYHLMRFHAVCPYDIEPTCNVENKDWRNTDQIMLAQFLEVFENLMRQELELKNSAMPSMAPTPRPTPTLINFDLQPNP